MFMLKREGVAKKTSQNKIHSHDLWWNTRRVPRYGKHRQGTWMMEWNARERERERERVKEWLFENVIKVASPPVIVFHLHFTNLGRIFKFYIVPFYFSRIFLLKKLQSPENPLYVSGLFLRRLCLVRRHHRLRHHLHHRRRRFLGNKCHSEAEAKDRIMLYWNRSFTGWPFQYTAEFFHITEYSGPCLCSLSHTQLSWT